MTGILAVWPDHHRGVEERIEACKGASLFQPVEVLVAGGSDDLVACDVRFDDEVALRAELGIPSDAPDSSLVLEAWRRWGDATPARLTGDFAFAIWSAKEQRLYFVRDHVGARPLYFARYEGGFAVASDQAVLLGLGIDGSISEKALIMALVDFWHMPEMSMYEGVERLSGGHFGWVDSSAGHPRLRDYWRLPATDLVLGDDSEYLEGFRELFVQAVRSRLNGGRLGVEFSGGIDSSAVAGALVRERSPVALFSGSFASPVLDGGRYDELAFRAWAHADRRFDCHEVPAELSLSEEAVRRSFQLHRAPLAGAMTLIRLMLYDTAVSAGVTALFDGVDGDATVIPATDRLLQLARTLQLQELGLDLVATVRRHGRAGAAFAAHSMIQPLRYLLSTRRRTIPDYVRASPVKRSALEGSGLLAAIDAGSIGDVRTSHVSSIRDGLLAAGLESTASFGAALGLEVLHPFADKRLIEFAVSLPAKQLYRHADTRYIERVSLSGLAPASVMMRGSKGAMPPTYARKYMSLLRADELVAEGGGPIADLVDPDRLESAWQAWQKDSGITAAWALLPLVITARWLESYAGSQAGH